MYGKEEFIERLREKKYYNTLLEWLEWFSNPDALKEIHRRHDDMPDNMPECYVWECAKWYIQTKMCDVQDFVFRKNGMKAEEEVYHYPPYHPGAFLATLYAIFATDPYRWTADDDKFYKLETYMKKNGFMSFYKAIRTIIDRNELPPRPRYANRAAFSFAGNRRQVEHEEEPKPAKEPASGNNDVVLSVLFSQELLSNDIKRKAFIKGVHDEVTPKVLETKGSREAKWKWPHVQQALYDSKHIVTLDNRNEFGRSMSPIAGCTATSISQTFKRFEARDTDANIILAIRKVIDDAITQAGNVEKTTHAVEETIVETAVVRENHEDCLAYIYTKNVTLGNIVQHIMILEPYFSNGYSSRNLIEVVCDFVEKCSFVLDKFEPQRERHTMCQMIHRLQGARFIRRDVPAMELAIQLAKSFDKEVRYEALRDKLMNCDLDRLPDDHRTAFDLFERVAERYKMDPRSEVRYPREIKEDAHQKYLQILDFNEKSAYENTVCVVLSTRKAFKPWMTEDLVRQLVRGIFDSAETTMIANDLQAHQSKTTMVRIVSALYDLGAYEEGLEKMRLSFMLARVTKLNSSKLHECLMREEDEYKCLYAFLQKAMAKYTNIIEP